MCDGDVQCKYGEDEKNCNGKCHGGALWCEGKKKCIPKWQICNGIQNCPDGKDEMVDFLKMKPTIVSFFS